MGKAAKEGARKEEPVGLALYLKKIKEGPEANWTKDELLTCLHWQKQITAVILGLLWGSLGLTGLQGFVTYAIAQLSSTLLFYRLVMRVDEERHGGAGGLIFFDNLPAFVALFLLAWILSYNAFHVS